MTITRICADILLSGIVRLVILFYLCSKLHIMMGKRTTALQYAFRASLPIMAGYRHGSCWRSSHYAYTFRPFRGIPSGQAYAQVHCLFRQGAASLGIRPAGGLLPPYRPFLGVG